MFSKYKYVYALYTEGSFTKAAQRLFISQPSLSAAIKSVEKEVGAPLFERRTNGVRLTEIGEEYIRAAEEMQSAENAFVRKLNDIYSLDVGSISVGSTNYISSYLLPRIITKFSSVHPKIEVTPVEANSQALAEMVRNERIDLVLDSFDEPGALYDGLPLVSERIFLCVPNGFKINNDLDEYKVTSDMLINGGELLDSVPVVPLEKFKDESFILLKNGNDMHYRASRIFSTRNMSPKVLFSVDQLNISYALAESGMGICFVTDTLIKYSGDDGKVSFYKIDDECCTRTLYVAYKRGRYCTMAMREFIEVSKNMLCAPLKK